MDSFFGGMVLILYLASHFAAEPIFVAATAFGSLFPVLLLFVLHFGGAGRVISAKRKTKRFVRYGVISGDNQSLYYNKCIKGAPSALRSAYGGFLRGEISADRFLERIVAAIKDKKRFFLGWYFTSAASLTLLVFLVFYFTAPFSETVLRAVITAFMALSNGTILRFVLFGYDSAARKAAVELAELLDAHLLRAKKRAPIDPSFDLPLEPPSTQEEDQAAELRALLREVEKAGASQ